MTDEQGPVVPGPEHDAPGDGDEVPLESETVGPPTDATEPEPEPPPEPPPVSWTPPPSHVEVAAEQAGAVAAAEAARPDPPLLEVDDLVVEYGRGTRRRRGGAKAVDGASFHIEAGERVALVGESGSGKTTIGLTAMGLLSSPGRIVAGDVRFAGESIAAKPERELRHWRGRDVGMVFQDPGSALNPTMRIGAQIGEAITVHDSSLPPAAVRVRVGELLEEVGVADPGRRARDYPHQLSGGMRQRVLLAMALANRPRLLIADEPTTALDVTTQAQVLELLTALGGSHGLAVLLVTHDLAAVAGFADRVVVLYAGRVAEQGTVDDIFQRPSHPYTRGLLEALPTALASRDLRPIPGSPPSPSARPRGCAFHPRCEHAIDACLDEVPVPRPLGGGHEAACIRVADLVTRWSSE